MDLNERLDEVINQSTNKFNIIKDNVRLTYNNIYAFINIKHI